MDTDCCNLGPINDLENHFDQIRATDDAKEYLEDGLHKRGEKLIAYLDTETPGFKSALDIGCGAGALHHELLLRGLIHEAVGVDASADYLKMAQGNADKLKLGSKVRYLQQDFALHPGSVQDADIVVLDRVICCYPDLDVLLEPAIAKARYCLLLSYPRDTILERLLFLGSRIKHIITRSKFRLYYHEPRRITELVESSGFSAVHEDVDGEWQLCVYERN